MNRLLFGTLAVLMLCAPLAAQEQSAVTAMPDITKPITVDQALEIAFCQSPAIQEALAQIQRSEAVIDEARANYMPKFNAAVVQQWQGPPVSFVAPGATTPINIAPSSTTKANANVFLPLDINNSLGYTTQIARYQNEINYLNLRSVSQQLIFDVRRSYYDLLRAIAQEEVAQAAVDVATARLRDANARFAAGTAPRFDVTSAQVDIANLNQELIATRSRVAVARTALNRVIGVDINSPTEPVRSEVAVENLKVDIPQRVAQGQALRPEALSLERAIALNRTNAKLQRTAILPSLNATGQYNYDFEASGFSGQNQSWAALLTLNIPIWDGGIAKARVAQAYADVNRVTQQLEQLRLGIGTEVRTAALNLQEAIERVASTGESVALAEEALRLANVRYEAGISTIVEVTDAERSLTQARFFAVQARYDYATALADLQRATSTQPELQRLQLLCPQAVTP